MPFMEPLSPTSTIIALGVTRSIVPDTRLPSLTSSSSDILLTKNIYVYIFNAIVNIIYKI